MSWVAPFYTTLDVAIHFYHGMLFITNPFSYNLNHETKQFLRL